VVIRRLLPGEIGPSGGAAMTDVLGICVSWADGQATVRREDGSLVEMATADIISGKPVPPRPSLRHRVSPAEAQRRAFALFPDLETVALAEWILRRSVAHPARRGNSVLAMGSAPTEAIHAVTQWYAARDQRPLAAVLVESSEEAMFLAAGWRPESDEAHTEFLIGSVAHAQRTRVSTDDVTLREVDGLAVAQIGSVASGTAAYADDWIGFRGIEVDPEHRRQGHGLAIMAELLEWGAEQGARTAYLQVLSDNTAAKGLYGTLGFGHHHTYRYLAAPE
jgi:N-acetylglutamate synthase